MNLVGERYWVFGLPLTCVTPEAAVQAVEDLAKAGRSAAVASVNTRLAVLALRHPQLAKTLRTFDLLVAGSHPIVWHMAGAPSRARRPLPSPKLMRLCLERLQADWKHAFVAESRARATALAQAAAEWQPRANVVGAWEAPSREEAAGAGDLECALRAADPDFVWVALGEGCQEEWIAQMKQKFPRGVFCAAADSLWVPSEKGPAVPRWVEGLGLRWLWRLVRGDAARERLAWKIAWEFTLASLRAAAFSPSRGRRIAFMGSRGVPARYSGFEVVVENLGQRLSRRGFDITVYNRLPHSPLRLRHYAGMNILNLPTIPTKSLDTIVHTALCTLHALVHRFDLIYLCGVGNAVLGAVLRLGGIRVVLNVDGADFRRTKWGFFARLWLRGSEQAAPACANAVIADNPEVQKRYKRMYGVRPHLIGYGAILRDEPVRCGELERWGLVPRGYILYVSRLTPENEALALIEAHQRWGAKLPLVVCGTATYEFRYYRSLRRAAAREVIFTGGRFGDAYIELSQHSAFFVMPAIIEATRLVLLDQMGMSAAILFRDAPATREVLGEAAWPYKPGQLEESLERLASDPALCRELGRRARQRAEELFSWETVTSTYIELFRQLGLEGS